MPLEALKKAWSAKGGLPGAYGAQSAKTKLEAALGWPKWNVDTGFSDLGAPDAVRMEPERVQNQVMDAIRDDDDKITKLAYDMKISNAF